MATSRDDAREMLARADAAHRTVRSRAAWDYRAYLAWGVWLLLFMPPMDFVDRAVWGVVVSVASGLGTLLTVLYFNKRTQQVHLRRAAPMRRWFVFWALWAAWYAAWIVAASALRDDISFGFTLVGIAGAVPCFIAGYASWRAR